MDEMEVVSSSTPETSSANQVMMAAETECKPCCVLLDDREVDKFYCPESDKYVVSASNLITNSPAPLPSEKLSFRCQICRKDYVTRETLCRHVTKVHKTAKYCTSCDSLFLTREHFFTHLKDCIKAKRDDSKNTIYSCTHCQETYKVKCNLNKHIQQHHTPDINAINGVDSRAVLNIKLYTNITTKTDSESRSKLMVHCVSCGDDFKYEKFFLEHFQLCSRSDTYVCPFCSMSKVHLANTVEHIGKHISVNCKFSGCADCPGKFFSDLNARIHASRMHKREIIKLNAPVLAKPRIPKSEMELTGFNFLDFLSMSKIPVQEEASDESTNEDEKTAGETSAQQSGLAVKKTLREVSSIKNDIQRVITIIEEKGMLDENLSVYCNACKSVFCIETFTMHLVTCLKNSEFSCPFCEGSVGEELGILDRWGHIKFHLISLSSSLIPGGSVCVMCDEAFLTEYNMAIHAQYVHFL